MAELAAHITPENLEADYGVRYPHALRPTAHARHTHGNERDAHPHTYAYPDAARRAS